VRWADNQPDAAANWAQAEPDGETRRSCSRYRFAMAADDVNAAVSWVQTLPAGTARDAAMDAVALRLSQQIPRWPSRGETINSGDLRQASWKMPPPALVEERPRHWRKTGLPNANPRRHQARLLAKLGHCHLTVLNTQPSAYNRLPGLNPRI